MHQDLDNFQGPANMDVNVKTRGLQLTSNNNADQVKNTRSGHGKRSHPRGGNDANVNDPRRQAGGSKGRRNHQQRSLAKVGQQQASSSNAPEEHQGVANMAKMMMEDEFEVGSVFNAGSKKQNMNHLLNFQFEPRGATSKKSSKHQSKKHQGSFDKPKYNKEQYLQANCQFVVKPSGDYTVHLSDPDTLVNWDLIEQVVLKTTASVPSCPICLYPPKAAKVTRCGHVFCWPCILHYLALSDQSWRKCPICFESIHRPDLKSVISIPWNEFQVNDEIELCLMRRERNSLFALPVDQYYPEVNEKHPNVSDKLTSYSNIVLATPGQVVKGVIAKERYELEQQYRDEKDEPEACFIEEALQYLSQREAGIDITESEQYHYSSFDVINEESSSCNSGSSSDDALEGNHFPIDIKEEVEESRPRYASSSSDGTVEEDLEMITAEDLDIEMKSQNKGKPKDTFYFYQSSDGQPIFLHALNVHMLIQEYGSLENCPKKIRGRIIEKDNASMTECLRNKLRYLRHMPLTSIFEVCEIQLKSPTVSKDTLQEFAGQLEARRRKRNRRAREERRREKWIQVEENKRMGKYPEMKKRIESAFHFPEIGGEASSYVVKSEPDSLASSIDSNPGCSNDFSFAKMLKEGVAKPSSYVAKPQNPLPASLKSSLKNEDSEPEPEDYVPPPPKANLGDALAHAFAQATTISGNQEKKQQPSKKNKKMKGQKISLTGSARPMMD